MKRAAVIGLGTISSMHIEALKRLLWVELCGVCGTDESRKQAVGEIPFYTDYHEMLREQKPDCVHICLPHWLHYPVAKACAEAGSSVFCEKPLAVDVTQALAFAELEQQYPELKIGVCLQNRWNPSFRRLRELLESGEYGRLLGLRATVPWSREQQYYDEKPWRGNYAQAGSGVLMNQGIHTLDLMCILGGPVASVCADTGHFLDFDLDVEDTVSARIDFANGVRGIFFATNANAADQDVEFWVIAEKGRFLLFDGKLLLQTERGFRELANDEKPVSGKFYYGSSHQILIERFYRALEGENVEYTHAKDGVNSIRLIDAMLRSHGRKVRMCCPAGECR